MHTFQIRKNDWPSLVGTLSVKLYALGDPLIANGPSGDTLSLVVASGGLYQASVAEDLDGVHYFAIYLDTYPIADGAIFLDSLEEVWDVDSAVDGAVNVNVAVLPGFVINQRRNMANAIDLYTEETGTYHLPVLDSNKEPLDLTGKTITIRFATKAGVLLETIAANSDVVGTLTFTATSTLTENPLAEGVFSVRDSIGDTVVTTGIFNVRKTP